MTMLSNARAGADRLYRSWLMAHEIRYLHEMPDSLLKDIGLQRWQINAAVLEGSPRARRR